MTELVKERIKMKEAWADPETRKRMSGRPNLEARNIKIREAGAIECAKCGVLKVLSDFPQSRKNRKGQPRYAYCKICHGEKQRELRLKNFFNISIEEYETICESQGRVCAICKLPPKKVRLAIDHDHKTGLIRGLLCSICNRAIARFRDDVEKFKNAVEYFTTPPASKALGEPRYGLKGRVTNKAATRKKLNGK